MRRGGEKEEVFCPGGRRLTGRQKARPRDPETWGGGLSAPRSPVSPPKMNGWESEVWEAVWESLRAPFGRILQL